MEWTEKMIWSGIRGVTYIGNGKVRCVKSRKVAGTEAVTDELWDCFLQGWNDECEYDEDRMFHKYLQEYAKDVRSVIDEIGAVE